MSHPNHKSTWKGKKCSGQDVAEKRRNKVGSEKVRTTTCLWWYLYRQNDIILHKEVSVTGTLEMWHPLVFDRLYKPC